MTAYLIADIDTHDPDLAAEYRRQVKPLIERLGGTYLVRGGDAQVMEGTWQPNRLVVIAFPSMAQAQAFYDSPDYAPVKDLRLRSSNGNLVIVEGMPE